MILMLQGNDQISVCNRPGLHSIPHHCSPLLNTTPLLSSDCSSADDDHREGQDDNDSKIFYSQSPQSGITLILIFCDPPHHDHDHLSLYHHWIFSLIGLLPVYVSSCSNHFLLYNHHIYQNTPLCERSPPPTMNILICATPLGRKHCSFTKWSGPTVGRKSNISLPNAISCQGRKSIT